MRNFVITLVIIFAPIALVGGLVLHHADADGVRTIRYVVDESSPYVKSLLPSERVEAVRDTAAGAAQSIIDEPVYFSVEAPGEGYEQVRVELAFDPHEQPIVELGALTDVQAYAFDFRPMANSILEHLEWPRLTLASDGVQTVLFSRDEVKATVEDFLLHPPERSEIATYRATFPTPYRMENYRPLGATRHITTSLRGSHEFLTYVKDENVQLSVTYSDVNRTYGPDEGTLRVWSEDGTLMAEQPIVDDRNVTEDQASSSATLRLTGRAWAEGVYRVEMSGTSDIIWRSIDTTLRYVTFKNRLYIGDDVGYLAEPRATAFVTNAHRVTLETFHAESPDEAVFGGKHFVIPETHTKVVVEVPD
ncbi:MAG: hypothetical protein NUV56_01265, partial [Candidatus Uhrbacteria bacterium]|nr:hypothetical protein [Candidatus Uhrbacteria bacterium]